VVDKFLTTLTTLGPVPHLIVPNLKIRSRTFVSLSTMTKRPLSLKVSCRTLIQCLRSLCLSAFRTEHFPILQLKC
jgi:hypothetical protein